ncbi:MAG: amidase [Alphaproteobacteria bacterium]|nr:MAG: amidase [Alphaproteobacteria bacterium]
MRRAGFIVIGRTNMTEFAYSGLGLNPHYGTPKNPFDRAAGRIPGGSSSGAAVSVADGMAAAAIGTDTGGSCRIPAAFCGVVGFKPTARRVSLRGVLPLAPSLDSVGPLAPSVTCCAHVDAILSGGAPAPIEDRRPGGLRIAVLRNYVLDGMDSTVAEVFESALSTLSAAGVALTDIVLPDLDSLPALNAKGGLVAAEAFAWHRERLDKAEDAYDPRVAARIARGREQSAADYIDLLAERRRMIQNAGERTAVYDAVLFPTVPVVAPTIAAMAEDTAYMRANGLVLRNSTVANMLDRCAISIPLAPHGAAPIGLTLMGEHGEDRKLFSVARTVERLVSGDRNQI